MRPYRPLMMHMGVPVAVTIGWVLIGTVFFSPCVFKVGTFSLSSDFVYVHMRNTYLIASDSFKSGVVVRNPGLQVTCRFFRGAGDGSSICHAAPVDPANPPVIPFPK